MKANEQFSVALHILTYIELNKDKDFSSTDISNSVNTNSVVIRRILSKLKKANLVDVKKGKRGEKLKYSPDKISFANILKALNKTTFFTLHENINKNCPTCANLNDVLSNDFENINKNILTQLQKQKLSDFIKKVKEND